MSELQKLLESKKDLTPLELVVWWVADDGTKEAMRVAEQAAAQLAAQTAVLEAVQRYAAQCRRDATARYVKTYNKNWAIVINGVAENLDEILAPIVEVEE